MGNSIVNINTTKELLNRAEEHSSIVKNKEYQRTKIYYIARYFVSLFESKELKILN